MTKKGKDTLFYTIATIIILGIGITLFVLDATTAERAQKKLEVHLKNKYKEEFVVRAFGQGRGSNFEAEVFPKRYVGTPREYDKYYRGRGIVPPTLVPRDEYDYIIFRESLNEIARTKLEEIFGPNILPIFTRGGEGAIYIFGTIKNEKDIKKYQEGIFKYVQHLKAINNFKIAKIAFIVIDERVLEDDFYDLGIKSQLIDAKEESKTEKEFLVKREKIMSQIKITSTDKSERIEGINRGKLSEGHSKYFGYVSLVGTTVISPGMFKANHITYPGWYPEEYGKTYEKINEIELRRSSRNYFKRE